MTTQEAMVQTGRNLRRIREEKGFSIAALAILAGIDEDLLSNIENGNAEFMVSLLFDLAALLNVDFRRIMVDTALYR